ncbi:nuclear transport factor 2 family protein [Streptomyces kaniharaensis]|uniref:nuclear transport factor 2 family protein n=1 Tax=Streptomyces kaniharaensis TaxID=212423 RepID=UPI002DDCC888|nr:nuclear transport factor 2 family protein [Streptomyces kaniharaensis]
MKEPGSRTPQEVFQSHGKALVAEDLDGIVANYAPDASFITPAGVRHGHDGVREGFARLFADLPHARWDLKIQAFEGEVLFLECSADSDTNHAEHGVDTFVFRNGFSQTQTVRYTLTPTS